MSGYVRNVTLKESFGYAIQGIRYALASQRNVRIHAAAAIAAVGAGIGFRLEAGEWAVLSIAIFLVLVTEIMNTAIEITVDMFTSEYNSLAKRAKNLAAGAVFLAALNSVSVGACLFGPRIWALLQGWPR